MKTGRKPKPLHERVKSRSVGINDKDYIDILNKYGSLTRAVKTEILTKLKTSNNVGEFQNPM